MLDHQLASYNQCAQRLYGFKHMVSSLCQTDYGSWTELEGIRNSPVGAYKGGKFVRQHIPHGHSEKRPDSAHYKIVTKRRSIWQKVSDFLIYELITKLYYIVFLTNYTT